MSRRCLLLILLAVLETLGCPERGTAEPTVTITGLVDQITSWSKNMSIQDLNYARPGDTEWYSHTRIRPVITAEIGTTQMVTRLEVDLTWGLVGDNEAVTAKRFAVGSGPVTDVRLGTSGGAPLNTDVLAASSIGLKWMYTEFNVPRTPWPARLRLGVQPFDVTYKPGVLATSDFAGVHAVVTFAPTAKLNLTYIQIEEVSTGIRDFFVRGEDYAIAATADLAPSKRVQLRPVYLYASFDGVTTLSARQGRGGLGTSSAVYPLGAVEERHTVGVDGWWRSASFSFEPTVFYQWGSRQMVSTAGPDAGLRRSQGRSAWLADVRSGWFTGPLQLDLALIYTTGNTAGEDVRDHRRPIRYFEPIATDFLYYVGWAEILAIGVDYFNLLYAIPFGVDPGIAIGYDKYGLARIGGRARYVITEALTLRTAATGNWAAEQVDSASSLSPASGLTPGDGRGNSRYLGAELDLGLQYRFAPRIMFDVAAGHLFSGPGMSTRFVVTGGQVTNGAKPRDVDTVAARVRFTF